MSKGAGLAALSKVAREAFLRRSHWNKVMSKMHNCSEIGTYRKGLKRNWEERQELERERIKTTLKSCYQKLVLDQRVWDLLVFKGLRFHCMVMC